jgi:hypothetical protein
VALLALGSAADGTFAKLPNPGDAGTGSRSTTANPPSASVGGASQSGRGHVGAAGQWPNFLIPGTVVMCQQGGNGAAPGRDVTLSAISMTTGQRVASRTFSLPSWASPGYDCYGYGLTSSTPVRQMFNRSFTSMAVAESLTDGQFVTVMNLENEHVTPVPTPSGFTSQPQQEDPQFDPATQEVWYTDSANDQIGVFDPASGNDMVKAQQSYSFEVAAGNGNYWPVDGYNWAVSPDGQHIVIADDDVEQVMYFADAGVAVSGVVGINTTDPGVEVFQGDSDGTTVLPGSDSVDCEAPAAWVDDTHLLCYEQDITGTNIGLVTFAPSGNSVENFQANLLPPTDRTNGSLTVSPDRKSFAFLSLDGTTLSLYQENLAPGSLPIKITDISTDAGSEDFPFLLQWN